MTHFLSARLINRRFNKLTVLGLIIIIAFLLLSACNNDGKHQQAAELRQQDVVSSAAQKIEIKVKIEHNYTSNGCPNNAASCYKGLMTLTLPASMPNNWRILFSHLSPIQKALSEQFSLKHLNGDLHEISPIVSDLAANTAYSIIFYGYTPLVSESVLFPNYLLVSESGKTSIIASTTEQVLAGNQVPRPQHVEAFIEPEQQRRNANDVIPIANPNERFERFASRNGSLTPSHEQGIIPTLARSEWSGAWLNIAKGLKIPALTDMPAHNKMHALPAIEQRFANNAIAISEQGLPIKLIQLNNAVKQSYSLSITKEAIELGYADDAGLYYAMMSIAQLYDPNTQSLPIGKATDHPHLDFRGLHIDVSRNFRSKDFILKILDQMSYYKLNKFHFHLADDEAWRLQIDSLPELTEIGAFRCLDESERSCLLPQLAGGDGKSDITKQNSGFYSLSDYIEILQYAHARHIEVIPSFDMPGHSRAAIVSMNARYKRLMLAEKPEEARRYLLTEPEDTSEYRSIQHYSDNTLNPCIPSTYRFIEEVLGQLISMHNQAGVPLKRYHLGADETAGAWTQSPACAALITEHDDIQESAEIGPYFIEKVANIVNDLGIVPAAWSDGLSHANKDKLPTKVHANAWETLYAGGHTKAHEMINKGWDLVLSSPDVLYFDFPYEADPIEPGYYWGSRYTDSYQVFQFMPNNLPAHAEIWRDINGRAYEAKAETNIHENRQILGIQAQLWGETVRSNAQASYMLFPRLFVLAERAWHQPEWAEEYRSGISYSADTQHIDASQRLAMQTDWVRFSRLLSTKAMPQLIKDGLQPRVPLPGAIIEQGTLKMNTPFWGLDLEYKINDKVWLPYKTPLTLSAPSTIKLRARVPGTRVSSREQTLQFEEQ